jgi:hypothetical protein
LAQVIDKLVAEGKEFELPDALVTEAGIAVGSNFAENFWYYELDQIIEFDEQ